MSIEKISTEALVLGVYTIGENDALVSLYTKDFGVIKAKAISLRKSKKMQSHIITGRMTNITLVKGREVYRVVGCTEINIKSNAFMPIVECVQRFFHGEEKNVKLFDRLIAYSGLKDANDSHIKTCVYLEVLINLGYLDIEKIGLTKKEYIEMDTHSFYLHSFLQKSTCAVAIRQAIDISML